MKKTFIACDQALSNTGYAIASLKAGRLKLLKLGVKQTSSEALPFERLSSIKEWLLRTVETHNPELVFMEEVFVRHGAASQANASRSLIQVQTVIGLELYEQGIPCHTISSSYQKKQSWRRLLGIEGGSENKKLSKEFIYRTVPSLLTLPKTKLVKATGEPNGDFFVNEHSADAFCILLAGLALHIEEFSNVEPTAWAWIIEV